MNDQARHLVVMARQPSLGTGKRRLAADIGPVAAQRFYRNATAALLRRLSSDPRWHTWLAVTPDAAARGDRLPWTFQGRVTAQGRGDLGARMGRLLRDLPVGPVVIVGSDIPDIARHHIWSAFRSLGNHDWVFGPARDGGYWLIGAKRRPRLTPGFAGVRWSSATTLSDCLENLAGQRIAFLESLADIDRGQDLAAWAAARKSTAFRRV